MAGYFDASIVALGSFNPAIFQPDWFREHEILPENEIEAATKRGAPRLVVSNDLTSINFDSVRLEVLQDRWQVATNRLDWKNDLGPITASVFRLLTHTPITTVGLNHAIHRELIEDPVKVVERWVPVRPLAEKVGEPLSVGATVRASWESYRVSVTVEPSVRLKGMYVGQNYERQRLSSARELCEILDGDWTRIMKRADELAKVICPAESAP